MIPILADITIATLFIAWGVFAATAPVKARHVIDQLVFRLAGQGNTNTSIDTGALNKRINLYRRSPVAYAQEYRSEIRTIRWGGVALMMASGLALLWIMGLIG